MILEPIALLNPIHSTWLSPSLFEGSSLLNNPEFWKVTNLLVFAVFLIYILRKKIGIGKVFDRRGEAITKELEEAKREKHEAQQKLEEVLGRLKRLDQEIAEIRSEAEIEARKEDERIKAAAESDAERIQQTARREIEAAMKVARSELRAFVARHSVEMAEGLITREMRPGDSSRMLSDYAKDLAASGKAGGGSK